MGLYYFLGGEEEDVGHQGAEEVAAVLLPRLLPLLCVCVCVCVCV
jgi:hypothetical protein